jgi:hypothetical protein
MPSSERQRELRRRRSRKKKIGLYRKRAENASNSEKEVIARKLRELTPGADVLIAQMHLLPE